MRPTQLSARSLRIPLAALALPVLALVVVVVIGFAVQSSRANSDGGSPTPPPVKATAPLGIASLTMTPAYNGPLGIPAIHPEAALANSTGPHFTLADVEQYLAANPIADVAKGAPAPTVASFTCETPKQAAAQYSGIYSYRGALVCVVIISGSFIGSYSGPYLGGDVPTPAPFTKGVMIFDAYTGNIVAMTPF
jgi:hypothetical protein